MAEKRCFVIMSFSPQYNGVMNSAIRPAAEAHGYHCERADSEMRLNNVPSEIVRAIIQADLIVADISEPTANVFYELGISHCVGNKTLTITSKVKDIPFDITTWRAIQYKNDPSELDVLRLRLSEAIRIQELERPNAFPTNLVQEAGRDYFNLRLRVEESVDNLARTIERMNDFHQFAAAHERIDNTEVVNAVTREVRKTLVGGRNMLVSIAGPGAVGKSTFAESLKRSLNECGVTASVVPTDAYMINRADRIYQGIIGFDIDANDVDKLVGDVNLLLAGQPIEVSPYNHRTGKHDKPHTVEAAEVMILEGIHSFYPGIHHGPYTRWLKYFMYAAPNHARELKFIADFTERRYDIQTAYEHSTAEYDAYETHVLPYIRHADRVIEVDGYWRYRARATE
jgi:uridine kinase